MGCRGFVCKASPDQGVEPAALLIDFSCSAAGFPGVGLERLKGEMACLGKLQPKLKPSVMLHSFCHPAHPQAVPHAKSSCRGSRARVTALARCGVKWGAGRALLGQHLSTGWKSLSPSG